MKTSFLCLVVAVLASATNVQAQSAVCVLLGTLGNENVDGSISFNASDDEISVTYSVEGLSLGGEQHTLLFHQSGSLHSTDGSALGPSLVSIDMEVLSDGVSSGVVSTSDFTFVGASSIIGTGVSVQDNSGVRMAQCVIGRNNDESVGTGEVSNTDGVTEADCIFTSTTDDIDETLNRFPTGLESGFARFFQREDGLDIEIWASGFSSDAFYPFGVATTGNIALGASSRDIFNGQFSGEGNRELVGQLGPGTDTPPGLRVNTRFGSWTFFDTFPSLNGENSIVGRSIVIFDQNCNSSNIADSDCMALAQCVVGIVSNLTSESNSEETGVERAHALMDPTPITLDNNRNRIVVGTVDFVRNGNNITVRYFFTGLAPGPHTWHIHRLGDISSADGSSLMGHFIGDCSETLPCRDQEVRGEGEPPVLQEVGAIDGNAPIVANDRGFAYGEFDDLVITLNGGSSIVGRGIIVHDLDPSIRVSHGVIGRAAEVLSSDTPEIPEVFAAICVLQPTGRDNLFDASGYVRFDQPQGGNMSVTYSISDVDSNDNVQLPWGIYDYGFLLSVQDGISVGTRFVGIDDRAGNETDIGAINGGVPLTTIGRTASGDFVDSALTFSGQNSIVGRSVVVKSATDNSTVVAMCTIGIQEEDEDQETIIERVAGVSAVCTLQSTRLSPNQGLSGSLTFVQTATNVEISYDIQGLTDGEHGIHVHTFGSLHSTDGSATGPHFPGDCNSDSPCRPLNATEQTQGYIGNGFEIVSSNDQATGTFTDDVIEFRGVNSIIGRGTVVHGDGVDSGVRVAHCVIGRNNPEETFTVEEASNSAGVTQANCIFASTNVNTRTSGEETGHARFFQNTRDGGVDIEIWVDGLINGGSHALEIRQLGNVIDPNAPGDLFEGVANGAIVTSLGNLSINQDGSNGLESINSMGSWTFNDPFLSLNGENSIVGRTLSIRSSVPESPTAVVAQCVIGIARENDLPGGVLEITVDLSVQAEILGGVNLDQASTGTGDALVTYDPNNRLLSWLIVTRDLTSELQQLHFHGPANRLMSGSLQINATAVGTPLLGETGYFTLTEEQARDLINGLWYINVHTVNNPSGELRGQVAPRDVEFTVDLTVEAEVIGGVILNQPSTGSGVAQVTYNPVARVLAWDIDLTEPTLGNLVQLHFHGPASRFVGGSLQVNATALGMSLSGQTALTAQQGRDLLNGLWYINVHTVQNPSGELRGQVAPPVGIFRAHAVMEPAADSPATNSLVRGTVDFARENGAPAITVRYFFTGLAPGEHTWHIHRFGNITSPNGTAVLGHFIGDCSGAQPCRPPSSLQEVGAIEDSVPIIADMNGNSYDVFTDSVIDFNGVDSIIGRGIIVHDLDPQFRISQGVIGIAGENAPSGEFTFSVNVSPEAVVDPLGTESSGTGRIEVVLNPNTNELNWNLEFSGLTSGSEAMRAAFLGPADRSLQGDEQVVIEDAPFTSPSMGMVTIDDDQVADLLNGMWYMLVSTADNEGGELRGQIADELPLFEITVPLTAEQEIAGGVTLSVTPAGTGSADITYNPNTLVLSYSFVLQDLSSNRTFLHFHGPAGRLATSGVQVNVTSQGLQGQFRMSAAQSSDFLDGLWYINIHTISNPSGELRGQIAEEEPLFSVSTVLTSQAVVLGGQGLAAEPTIANATFEADYNPNTGEFQWELFIPNAGSDVGATFHAAASEIETADIVALVPITLTVTNGGRRSLERVNLNQVMNDRLLNGQWYVRVSTADNPNGELRAQVVLEILDAFQAPAPGSIPIPAQGQDPGFPTLIREAVCVIAPTALDGQINAAGWVHFSRAEAADAMNISYMIEQLTVGDHPWSINQFGNLLSNQDGLSTGGILIGNVDRPAPAFDFAGAIGDVGDGDGSVIRFVGADGENGIAEGWFSDEFLQLAGPNSIIGRSVVIQGLDGLKREAYCTIGISAEDDDVPVTIVTTAPVDGTTAPVDGTTPESTPDPTAVVAVEDDDSSSQFFPQWTVHLITTLVVVATVALH